MRLSPDQVRRFYAIWLPLLLFVNRRLRVEPSMLNATVDGRWDPRTVLPIRDALWADDSLREAFIAENPERLSPADLAIVANWGHRVAGSFFVFRHLKKHSLLIREGTREVYGVLGLASSLEEVTPFTPSYAKAVLLPFEGRIIYDSLLVPYNVYFGSGIRRDLEEIYKDAKERGAIITALPAEGRADGGTRSGEVSGRVVEAFRKHLYRTGLSPKVVERDAAAVTAFADYLAARPEPRSLRDFVASDVRECLASLRSAVRKETEYRQLLTGLKRFLRFLRDTDRMDHDRAQAMLELLKE
jgi:hypothetical protein